MARQTFMQYLITENQPQEVGPDRYTRFGDALNALAPIDTEDLTEVSPTDIESDLDLDANTYHVKSFEVGHYAIIGYIHAWMDSNTNRYCYTIERA